VVPPIWLSVADDPLRGECARDNHFLGITTVVSGASKVDLPAARFRKGGLCASSSAMWWLRDY
jgi:hypothetical protein